MVKQTTLLLVAVWLGACGPVTAAPSPTSTASGAPSASPAPSGSPAPATAASASPSRVPLPTGAQVAAAGNGVVWMLVAQTRLFVSTDRRGTWSERAAPTTSIGPDLSIASVDSLHGWAMRAGSPETQCQAQGVTLWATSDGARTWQPLVEMSLRAGPQPTAGIAAFQCKGDLVFADTRHGFFTAHDPNGPPTIYRTTDGGTTWAGARLPDPPGFTSHPGGFTLRAGAVADFGAVLLVSAVGNTGTRQATYVFVSRDGGASWGFAAAAPDLPPGAAVVFLTPTRWLAPLAPAPWSETTDGGASWHAYRTDYAQAAPIAPQIVFGDANTGYATVRGSLQRTTDGGAHWTTLRTPGT